MKLDQLKEFIKLAKDEGVASLKIKDDETTMEVSFGTSSGVIQPIASHVNPVSATPPAQQKGIKNKGDLYEIVSPLVGTFYGASAPGEEPFVKVGDRINKGDTLCIIEAMKIMNEVESDVSGEIVEVMADNENLVEFDQVLFLIKKS